MGEPGARSHVGRQELLVLDAMVPPRASGSLRLSLTHTQDTAQWLLAITTSSREAPREGTPQQEDGSAVGLSPPTTMPYDD